MKKILPVIALLGFCISGCTHNMHITNAEEYFVPPAPPLQKPLKLGILSANANHFQNSRYVSAIVDSLQRTGSFEKVIYPYSQSVHEGQADILLDISVNPRYTGKGSNFFINWPGFLIFAPAIWGYGYTAEIETSVAVTRVTDNKTNQIAIPTRFEFRQADTSRTWTEVGWLEVGIIPLIGGIVFTDYDPDVTDEFITKVSPNYGSFVAKKIVEGL